MKTLPALLLALLPCLLIAQPWTTYPYHEEGSVLYFPEDEGSHPGESIEWWYTNGRVTGHFTGTDYSFMLTYFRFPVLGFDGFRILNLTNEDTGAFYSETQPANYPGLFEDHLEIIANVGFGGSPESWVTTFDFQGNLVPWNYQLSASSAYGAVNLQYQALKPPLMVGGTGLVDQGDAQYSYYYSQTALEVSGAITFLGFTEPVSGIAWIDRQYGNFNPNTGEPYEWFSLQLSNGMDINLWNIFTFDDQIPDTSTYRIFTAFVDDTTTVWSDDFNLERLAYAWMPDSETCYAQQWHFTSDTLGLDLLLTTNHSDHEVQLPFRFYEGTIQIEGTVGGQPVTGQGFAELLRHYEHPDIQIVAPVIGEIWAPTQPIQWQLLNPDDGRAVYYDVAVSNDGKETWTPLVEDLTGTAYTWDFNGWPTDSLYWFRVTGHSIDSTLIGWGESDAAWPIISGTGEIPDQGRLRLFPNPAGRFALLAADGGPEFLNVRLHDASGALLLQQVGATPLRLELEGISPGSYWLTIENSEGHLQKMLIVH